MPDIEMMGRDRRRCRARKGESPGDRERVAFPPLLMDQAVYGFHSTFSDGSSNSTSPHRPGFRFSDVGDPLRLVAEQAYSIRSIAITSASAAMTC